MRVSFRDPEVGRMWAVATGHFHIQLLAELPNVSTSNPEFHSGLFVFDCSAVGIMQQSNLAPIGDRLYSGTAVQRCERAKKQLIPAFCTAQTVVCRFADTDVLRIRTFEETTITPLPQLTTHETYFADRPCCDIRQLCTCPKYRHH